MITAEFKNDIVNLRVTNLFQWDVNQVIKIAGLVLGSSPVEVHFCNKKSTSALVVNSTTPTNGYVLANIPNVLLTEPYDIVAYVYQTDGSTRSTTKTIDIPVVARKKPNDYKDTSGGTIIVPDSEVNIDLSSANITPSDIVKGKVGFGATGKMIGTHVCPSLGESQTKTVTPTKAVQTVEADEGKYLSSVTVNPIPNDYIVPNKTKTITTNGNHDVTDCSSITVNVASQGSNITTSFDATTGTLTITEG